VRRDGTVGMYDRTIICAELDAEQWRRGHTWNIHHHGISMGISCSGNPSYHYVRTFLYPDTPRTFGLG
jgi:hypothetical protein